MNAMMAIPKEFEIPIVFAAVRRNSADWSGWSEKNKKIMTSAKSDHMVAFMTCIGTAHEIVRSEYEGEVAQVISDNHGEMREILATSLNRLQGSPLPFEFDVRRRPNGPEIGTRISRADHIIDEVLFLSPRNAPFLQIADAVAYGIRRYLSRYRHGDEYFSSISGGTLLELEEGWTLFFCAIHEKGRIIVPPWMRTP